MELIKGPSIGFIHGTAHTGGNYIAAMKLKSMCREWSLDDPTWLDA